jgi:uncharacterized membrane protein YeiB
MSQFERDLRESLRRREPPAAFAAKVLARTRESEPRTIFSWRWLAVAALVILMVGGTMFIREQRQQAERQRAKEQLMVALRITGSKLMEVQARLDAIQERLRYPEITTP